MLDKQVYRKIQYNAGVYGRGDASDRSLDTA